MDIYVYTYIYILLVSTRSLRQHDYMMCFQSCRPQYYWEYSSSHSWTMTLLLMQNPRFIPVLWNTLPNLSKWSIYRKLAKPFPITVKMHISDVRVFSFPPLEEHWMYMNQDDPSIPEDTMSIIWANFPTEVNAEQRSRGPTWGQSGLSMLAKQKGSDRFLGQGSPEINPPLRIVLNAPFLPLYTEST